MTVEITTTFSGPYVGTGAVNQSFPVTFSSTASDEISVYVNNALVDPVAYTFTRNADGRGTVKATLLGTVYIYSAPDFRQETEFQKFGPYFPSDLNEPLDRAARRDIYLKSYTDRALVVGRGLSGYTVHPNWRSLLETGDLTSLRGANGPISGASAGYGALFTAAPGMTIGAGITAFTTSGYDTPGIGGARYIYDATLDASYVTDNPRVAFQAADGRVFRLDFLQRLTIEMFGGKADCYIGGHPSPNIMSIYGPILNTPTDNLPAFNAYCKISLPTVPTIENFQAYFAEGANPQAPILHFGKGVYYFSGTLEPRTAVYLRGTTPGPQALKGTFFKFPADTSGMVLNANNTANGTNVPSFSAGLSSDGTMVEGIYFLGSGGTDKNKHGIWMRATSMFRNCVIDNFAGCGMIIKGSNGGTGAAAGQVNSWVLESITFRANRGWAALWVEGTDANAGLAHKVRVKDTHFAGIVDLSGLGNVYISCQIDGTGSSGALTGANAGGYVNYAGQNWQLGVSANQGSAPSNDSPVWFSLGSDGGSGPTLTFPAWNNTSVYHTCMSIVAEGASNASVFLGGYSEGIRGALHNSIGLFVGGQFDFVPGSNHQYATSPGGSFGRCTFNRAALGVLHNFAGTQAANYGASAYARMGGLNGSSLWVFEHGDRGMSRWGLQPMGASDYAYAHGDITSTGQMVYRITGPTTDQTAGRGVPVPYMFRPRNFALNDPDVPGDTNSRLMYAKASVPVSGPVARGEKICNINASAGGFAEWIVTTSGTAGSTAVIKTANPVTV